MYHICQFFFILIITYINKGLNLFSLFFENVKDFKLNYYVQYSNSKITIYFVGNGQFSEGTDDQNYFLRVLSWFVVWGSEKLFLGVLTKNKIFYQLSFLNFYADSEF